MPLAYVDSDDSPKLHYVSNEKQSLSYLYSHNIEVELRSIRMDNEKLNYQLNLQHEKNSEIILENNEIRKKFNEMKAKLHSFRPMMIKFKSERD